MNVCMYTHTWIFLHAYGLMNISMHTHTWILCTNVLVCNMHMVSWASQCIHTHTHTYVYMYVHAHGLMSISMHTHTHTHTWILTCTWPQCKYTHTWIFYIHMVSMQGLNLIIISKTTDIFIWDMRMIRHITTRARYNLYLHSCIYTYTYIHTCTHIHIYLGYEEDQTHNHEGEVQTLYLNTYVHAYIHTYIHTYMHTYTYL